MQGRPWLWLWGWRDERMGWCGGAPAKEEVSGDEVNVDEVNVDEVMR